MPGESGSVLYNLWVLLDSETMDEGMSKEGKQEGWRILVLR